MPQTRRANAANGPQPVNSARFIVSDNNVCSRVPLKFSNDASRLPQLVSFGRQPHNAP
jgi:hypothetical protein